MAWSSLAHLPTNPQEYLCILSQLKDGMTIYAVDKTIAHCKGKEIVQHHYRSNLARIGLFDIAHNCIHLNYDPSKLLLNDDYLRSILSIVIAKNVTPEVNEISSIVIEGRTYQMQYIVSCLQLRYPALDRKNIIRWIRPIVVLLKTIELLSSKTSTQVRFTQHLQDAYLQVSHTFGNAVPLEKVSEKLKTLDSELDIVILLENLLDEYGIRYKIELLPMPRWATEQKGYLIDNNMFTHIRIKSDLFREVLS